MSKSCCQCSQTLPLIEYTKNSSAKDGLSYRCKECEKVNRGKRLEYNTNYTKVNKERLKTYNKVYNAQPHILAMNAERARIKRKTNPESKLKEYTRNRINECVKLYQLKKYDNTLDALGCSISDYVKHIQSQFNDNMSWDNYGEYWEIDHIKPLSKGGSFHYTNTQPLSVIDNRIKGDKYQVNPNKGRILTYNKLSYE